MKKIFAVMILCAAIFSVAQRAEAADEFVYTYPSSGVKLYIVRESVNYGVKTSFYAKARVKSVNSSGGLIKSMMMGFNRDEGEWWYSIDGNYRNARRVYDNEDSTALLRWLQAHRDQARRTANPLVMVLGD